MLTPKEIAYSVTKALDEKKGMNIKLLKIDKVSSLADYFLICTGTSNTHVRTLCDFAEYTLEQLGEPMLAGKAIGAIPGNCWTTAPLSSMCSPRKHVSSTPWSACGPMQKLLIFPKLSSKSKFDVKKEVCSS